MKKELVMKLADYLFFKEGGSFCLIDLIDCFSYHLNICCPQHIPQYIQYILFTYDKKNYF